ncbi:MAG: hypothetical protein RMK57_11295 [Bryobacterales bacterium]|nr:hypothetical protein [Bryobacteraceae bacterium]MDW8355104.1 hypothetical protein [Bryobacterales bacterium]
MPLVQIRDVPEHVYRRLRERAAWERRSVSQQALAILAQGLEADLDPKARRRRLLRAPGKLTPARANRLPDPVKLIREDRRR